MKNGRIRGRFYLAIFSPPAANACRLWALVNYSDFIHMFIPDSCEFLTPA